MKKRYLIIPALALALSANAAAAQQGPPAGSPPPGMGGPGGRGNARRMQMLLEGIALTPGQQVAMDSINMAFQARMPAFTPGTPPDSATRAQRTTVGAERDAALRAVLTADQQRLWDTNMQTMQANMPRRPGN